MLTGLFWDAVDSFAGLFDGFYYILTGESTSESNKFGNFADENLKHAFYTKEPYDLH